MMTQSAFKNDKASFGSAGLIGWVALVCAILLYCDLGLPAMTETSDFVSCLYTGAKLFVQHRFDELYTPYDMTSFHGAPADIAAHAMLPNLPQGLIAEFNYCPLVALLFSPLTFLPPNLALLAWQVISVAALFVSIRVIVPDEKQTARLLGLCFLFFPTVISIWIGQTDFVFGLLCLSLAYRQVQSGKDLAAGAIASVSLLKPQFAIIVGLIGMTLLIKRRWKFAAGAAVGVAVLVGMNLAIGGVSLLNHWLYTVKLCEKIFTDPTTGLQNHLMMSLPGNILLAYARYTFTKPLIYACSILIGSAAIARCVQAKSDDTADGAWIGYTFIVGTMLMPLMVPNFMLYDLPMFILPALIIVEQKFPLSKYVMWIALAINLFVVLLFTVKPLAQPVVLVLIFIATLAFLLAKSKQVPRMQLIESTAQ